MPLVEKIKPFLWEVHSKIPKDSKKRIKNIPVKAERVSGRLKWKVSISEAILTVFFSKKV